jgi:two-component system, chemotaxis family, protein-glutamate methylesterase/glutaminase
MAKIRVVLADDSSVARGLLRGFLECEDDIEVVGEASNGREAIRLVKELRPNLITLDLEMPVMTGLDAIEELMASQALPILVVSSVADAQNAYEAVRRGALDVVSKPEFNSPEAKEFVAKVRLLAGVRVITHIRPRSAPPDSSRPIPTLMNPAVAPITRMGPTTGQQRVFAIASSTGGPQALAQILPRLPADFPCPVLIAQHISDGFAQGMAEWLASLCKLPVRLATEGAMIQPGVIHISPSERHLAVTSARCLALVERGPLDVYRPSCDVLLNSVADVFGRQAVGIILTGMGSDGAQGQARIQASGGATLGQDETSSVIYGMNRVAIESGAVQKVLPLEAMVDEMMRLAGGA